MDISSLAWQVDIIKLDMSCDVISDILLCIYVELS